jgi:excisionase family DNA binding protein
MLFELLGRTLLEDIRMAKDLETPNNQEVFNNREAAHFLRISTITLYRERAKGKIVFRRVGAGKVIFTREDLDNYLEQQKRARYSKD